jgi:hypothetical protein
MDNFLSDWFPAQVSFANFTTGSELQSNTGEFSVRLAVALRMAAANMGQVENIRVNPTLRYEFTI